MKTRENLEEKETLKDILVENLKKGALTLTLGAAGFASLFLANEQLCKPLEMSVAQAATILDSGTDFIVLDQNGNPDEVYTSMDQIYADLRSGELSGEINLVARGGTYGSEHEIMDFSQAANTFILEVSRDSQFSVDDVVFNITFGNRGGSSISLDGLTLGHGISYLSSIWIGGGSTNVSNCEINAPIGVHENDDFNLYNCNLDMNFSSPDDRAISIIGNPATKLNQTSQREINTNDYVNWLETNNGERLYGLETVSQETRANVANCRFKIPDGKAFYVSGQSGFDCTDNLIEAGLVAELGIDNNTTSFLDGCAVVDTQEVTTKNSRVSRVPLYVIDEQEVLDYYVFNRSTQGGQVSVTNLRNYDPTAETPVEPTNVPGTTATGLGVLVGGLATAGYLATRDKRNSSEQ
jgi:hypothetical protein